MKIPGTVKEFSKILKKNNFQIFLVGGAVRDSILGKENHDYDFTTDATPAEVKNIFKSVIPVGIEHGTVVVLFEGNQFEITTFRSEADYSDNRHPDSVKFIKNLPDDLKRRDFTINAIAYDINRKKTVDLFEGRKDLKRGIIRAIGEPADRFKEDALRMLRACRFSSQLGFTIEENTLDAMRKCSSLIKNVSHERIRDEFIKMMKSDKPSIGIEYMRISGLMEYILPELLNCYGVVQNRFHKYDVYYHNLFSCNAADKNNLIVRIAALFHDISKPQTKKGKVDDEESENSFYNHEIIGSRTTYHILKRLKFPNEDIRKITHLIKYHMFYYTDEWTDGAVRRFLRNAGVENLNDLFALRDADRIGNGNKQGIPKTFLDFKDRIRHILEIDNALKVTDLDIDGDVLMKELNLKPGPLVGEILNYLLEIVLDDPGLNKSALLIGKAGEYYKKKTCYALDKYGKIPEELGKF
jgi:tRNA nucleotidyltransferase (CCA-adding enzyme)